MKREDINAVLRLHSKERLTPTQGERDTVSAVYAGIQGVLGASNTLQIGSYPRFTAITPLHDLDVLYVLGTANASETHPAKLLQDVAARLRAGFKNPTNWTLKIAPQTHSIGILFLDGQDEVLSVDIVPALVAGKNEFQQDTYLVPEIARRGHAARRVEYQRLAKANQDVSWIRSDPRGYIEVAQRTNTQNRDFRKAVKLVKAWHYACKDAFDSPLKSFHIEQIITGYFQSGSPDIFDAVFQFFFDLPEFIRRPQIRDRADAARFIDEYVGGIGLPEQRTVREARDGFLIGLENFEPSQKVGRLLAANLRERKSASEAYLFDSGIKTLTEYPLSIVATVLERKGGFREYILDKLGVIAVDRKIQFRRANEVPVADLYKWKVKNDDASKQPRGEITDHQTLNDPESTAYNGAHYVECYAIGGRVCIGKARQDVKLRSDG